VASRGLPAFAQHSRGYSAQAAVERVGSAIKERRCLVRHVVCVDGWLVRRKQIWPTKYTKDTKVYHLRFPKFFAPIRVIRGQPPSPTCS